MKVFFRLLMIIPGVGFAVSIFGLIFRLDIASGDTLRPWAAILAVGVFPLGIGMMLLIKRRTKRLILNDLLELICEGLPDWVVGAASRFMLAIVAFSFYATVASEYKYLPTFGYTPASLVLVGTSFFYMLTLLSFWSEARKHAKMPNK